MKIYIKNIKEGYFGLVINISVPNKIRKSRKNKWLLY